MMEGARVGVRGVRMERLERDDGKRGRWGTRMRVVKRKGRESPVHYGIRKAGRDDGWDGDKTGRR